MTRLIRLVRSMGEAWSRTRLILARSRESFREPIENIFSCATAEDALSNSIIEGIMQAWTLLNVGFSGLIVGMGLVRAVFPGGVSSSDLCRGPWWVWMAGALERPLIRHEDSGKA